MYQARFFAAIVAALLSFGFLAGCKNETPKPINPPAGKTNHHHHAHHEKGPHGGSVVELGGGKYHAELVHNDAEQSITIYLLDGELKRPVAGGDEIVLNTKVDGQPRQFRIPQAPAVDDPSAPPSRYALTDANLVGALDAKGSTGRLRVTIAGRQYTGDIVPHAHHD